MKRKPHGPLLIGPLSPNGAGKHWVQPPLSLPIPTRVTNSMQPTMTIEDFAKLPRPYIRPGADHSHIPSRGGC